MTSDVLKQIEETIIKGIEIALKQNTDYEKWVSMSATLSNISGICKGAILMEGQDESKNR